MAQTVRRVERRRYAADSGTRDCAVAGGGLVAGRSVFVLRPFQYRGSQYDRNFSPDGHWLAYFPDETGQPEAYVVPFPGLGGKYQIHMAADGSFAPSRSSLDNSSPASLLAPSP
jgi:hypothetical protein